MESVYVVIESKGRHTIVGIFYDKKEAERFIERNSHYYCFYTTKVDTAFVFKKAEDCEHYWGVDGRDYE